MFYILVKITLSFEMVFFLLQCLYLYVSNLTTKLYICLFVFPCFLLNLLPYSSVYMTSFLVLLSGIFVSCSVFSLELPLQSFLRHIHTFLFSYLLIRVYVLILSSPLVSPSVLIKFKSHLLLLVY